MARVIRETMKLPGYNVFKYVNGDGKPVVVTRRHINEYIKEVMGSSFSAKDFRTWAGTLVCACALARNGDEIPRRRLRGTKKSSRQSKRRRRCWVTLRQFVAVRTFVRRSSTAFEKGQVIDNRTTKLDDLIAFRGRGLHKAEQALLKFLKAA